MMQDELFMQRALELAAHAEEQGEVPVGALVVLDGEVIGEGFNCPISTSDPTAHAEIVALRDASRNVSNYRLTNADIYVTLEPCPMCAGAIVHARIKRVIFGARDPKGGAAGSVFNLLPSDARFNHRVEVTEAVMASECSHRLSQFFRTRRKEKKT